MSIELTVLSVPLEGTLRLIKSAIMEQLKKCSRIFCYLRDKPIASYQDHLECEYKAVLRHYLKLINDDKFEREQLYKLLPFNKNREMPQLLRNHFLKFSRQIFKRRYSPLQEFNQCAALLTSGQVSLYRELYCKN